MGSLVDPTLKTVRPRSFGKLPWLLCFLIFGLTVVVVYRWGYERHRPSRQGATYTATAYVIEQGKPGRRPFSNTAGDPELAKETANALAQRHVNGHLAVWALKTRGPLQQAKQQAAKAKQAYDEVVARRTAVDHRLSKKTVVVPPAELQPPAQAPMIDNPEWIELQQQLDDLRRQREELLVDRTPLHPAVHGIDVKIGQVEKQLATVPREIVGPSLETIDTAAAALAQKAASVGRTEKMNQAVRQERQQILAVLDADITKAQQAYDEAQLAEQQALAAQQAGPNLRVELAETVQKNPVPTYYGSGRLIWGALMAGSLLAFGIGMVSFGDHVEPAVTSVAEVESVLGNVILGAVPADELVDPAMAIGQARTRRTAMVVGAMLMVASPVLAFWGVT